MYTYIELYYKMFSYVLGWEKNEKVIEKEEMYYVLEDTFFFFKKFSKTVIYG